MPDVLIVDDEEDICDFLSQSLEREGLNVLYAVTGEQALSLIDENDFKVCVIDLKLCTTVTGMDVIKKARSRRPNAKVVAMSGYIDMGLRQEAEQVGVCRFFEKPGDLKPEVFCEKVKVLLR